MGKLILLKQKQPEEKVYYYFEELEKIIQEWADSHSDNWHEPAWALKNIKEAHQHMENFFEAE